MLATGAWIASPSVPTLPPYSPDLNPIENALRLLRLCGDS